MQRLVSQKAAYRMPTSKSGPWQKLVPIACRLSGPRYHGSHHERRSVWSKKNDIVSWKQPGSQFKQFAESMISPLTVPDVFNILCLPPHLASECSSRGGFVLVVSTFFYFCQGLFDMQHCCAVIMLGLWLSWRLSFVCTDSTEETKVHEKLLLLL